MRTALVRLLTVGLLAQCIPLNSEDLTGDKGYRNFAQEQRDYVLGANPWGVCWVNSAGKR